MAGERQRYALQTIFSFFLGLMVAAFIGVGVNTFYKSPDQLYQKELQQLYRQQEDIQAPQDFKQGVAQPLSAADQKKLADLRAQTRALEDKQQAYRDVWTRNTSIILIVFATFVMGVSLIRSEQLRVVSNGLLLGGLFTMLYGTGWVIASGSSTARFFVMSFALVVTLGLGYLKFVRDRAAGPAAAVAAAVGYTPTGVVASGALEARVTALETRIAAAAAAFGSQAEADVGPRASDVESTPPETE